MFDSLFDHSNEDQNLFIYISKNEKQLRADFQNKLILPEKTLEVIAAGLKEAKKQKLSNVEKIWNVAGYVNTCSFDLAVAGEALMFEQNSWKRRYYSRIAAINIYMNL